MAIFIVENILTKEVKTEKGWISERKAWDRAFGWKYKDVDILKVKEKFYKVINNKDRNMIGLIKQVK